MTAGKSRDHKLGDFVGHTEFWRKESEPRKHTSPDVTPGGNAGSLSNMLRDEKARAMLA